MPNILDYLLNSKGYNDLNKATQGTQIQGTPQGQENMSNPLVHALIQSLQNGSAPLMMNPMTAPIGAGMNMVQNNMGQMPVQQHAAPLGMASTGSSVAQNQQSQYIPPSPIPQQQTAQSEQPNKMWEFIKNLGIPAAAAIGGSAFPGALPELSGFNTGYVGSLEKNRDFKRKKELAGIGTEIYSRDPDTGELVDTGVRVPKNSKVMNITSDKKAKAYDEFMASLGGVKSEVPKLQTEQLPQGVTEEDIQYTMKKRGLSREEVIKRMNK